MRKFNEIESRNDLSAFLRIPIKKLTHVLYVKNVDNCYTTFSVPKRNGGVRQISAPNEELKSIQRNLSFALWEYQQSVWKDKKIAPNISHAFEKKKSIISNAKVHRNKRFVMNIDLEDFFGSFHFGRVRGFFQKNRDYLLPREVATIVAQLACFNGKLPQGSPSSPIITNLICQFFDIRILKLAKKYKLDYTRYADDLTFSTNNKSFLDYLDYEPTFLTELSQEVSNAGFSINEKKTRLQYKDSQQTVTGLVVNKKLNVERNYYKATRSMAHHLYANGEFEINGISGTVAQLEGRFAFINQLDIYNNKLDNNKHTFRQLNGRENQYQKFLFFKYFFSNDKPLIITEGKTDVLYLKAALKNLHLNYPRLIVKNSEGKFEFKISFFKKTRRIKYFLGIYPEGADTMKNLYNYFIKCSDKTFPNYLDYFTELSKNKAKNPVVLVFDNELQHKSKPLKGFVNHVNLSEPDLKTLKTDLYIRLIDDGNLFLTANPLVKKLSECEIEDLFDEKILAHSINGKTFNSGDNFDNTKYYGKDRFSKYILENYEKIDFSNFSIILDNIQKIVDSYDN